MIRPFRIYIFLLSVCIFFSQTTLSAQDEQQRELKTLREEIQKFERQLSQQKEKEKTAAELIAKLDREIDLTSGLLHRLQVELDAQERQIAARMREIAKLQTESEQLKEMIQKRLISFYKHGRRREYELLLADGGWKHLDVWLRYQKMIAENDRRNYRALTVRKEKLEREKMLLAQEKAQKELVLASHQQTAAGLKAGRSKRAAHLKALQKDGQFIRNHLQELQAAQKQIQSLIAEKERERRERERLERQKQVTQKQPSPPSKAARFAALQGRLPWPAEGTVISRFGRTKHPTLNTVTENLGIEIRAPLGAPVRVVDDGRVETITWQRGRGNIIIISHDDGYYTVYTHLAEIRVELAQAVQAGEVIGTIGDSGSLNGPVLHFQIWKNTENLDPEKWLVKGGGSSIALNEVTANAR